MAEHDLSILVKAKGALQAAKDIGKVDSAVGGLNKRAQAGARAAITNVAKIGVVAAGGIGIAVHSGIENLAKLEDATTSVDGAIKQVGLTGQLTSTQVATWANEIEANVQAAFDDKDIVSATTTMLRFGKVTPQNLKPAMEVMTDLATKTGSVDSAASLLAKALADPEKAAGKLARAGVILTKEQQKQIKAFMKAGDEASAQKVILDALAKSTKGAAAASKGPYRDAMNILGDVTEDAQKALATGFLPVLQKVADLLSSELAKPGTMDNIKKFGEGLAGGLDDLIDIAKNLPWKQIGDSLKVGAGGAKAILGLFSSMPPWVQTAVLTGWGLNKLTGGALGGIVGELGKGLVKGVLGMNAGVVNIKAGVVTGAGGVPGASAGGGMSGAAKAAVGATIIGGLALSAESINEMAQKNAAYADQGLNAAERQAVNYYQSSKTDQSYMAKRLGKVPSVEDFRAGMAKLSGSVSAVQKSVDVDRAASVAAMHGTTSAVRRKKLSVKVSNLNKTSVKVAVTAAGVKQSITHLQRATKSGGTYTSGGYD